MPVRPVPDEDSWITVEETDDEASARHLARGLRSSGITVRTERVTGTQPGLEMAQYEVQVPFGQLDEALAALEPFDDDEGDEPPGGDRDAS